MIRNYLVILYRNFIRQFSYSFINIVGLATGLACSLVIFLYVYGEWSYDRAFPAGERIYRIGVSFFNIGKFASGPEKLLTDLPAEFAGIETATRIESDRVIIRTGTEEFAEQPVYFTDTAYFHIFTYVFADGNARTALKDPHEAVLTEGMAEKYFGKRDVVGQILEIGKDRTPFKITGVVKRPDFNTHLKAEVWLSIQNELTGEQAWSSASFYNYVLLRKNVSEGDLKAALDKLVEKHVFPESGKPMGFATAAEYIKSDISVKFYIHHFQDIYLRSKLNMELSPSGNENNIIVFGGISFFILVLAAVNFVNLTTARASKRAKEVGIRKTLGTSRERLIAQFLTESVLTSTLSMGLALVLAEGFLFLFEYLMGTRLISTIVESPVSLLMYFGVSILVGILSGIYPSFYLTAFSAIKVLKGNLSAAGGNAFRNMLVVFQFTVSIILIICTVIVVQQLKFMQTTDLGFDQQNVVTIDQTTLLGSSASSFKDELSTQSGVTNVSFHGGEPGSKRIMTFQIYQSQAVPAGVSINTYFGDAGYCSLMGFHLVKGRFFSKDLASDSMGIILNEEAVKLLDLGDQPIGAVINKDRHVIGVVSNFHWESLRNTIGPTAILLSSSKYELGFKITGNSVPQFLKKAEDLWKARLPSDSFHYHFLDDNFGEMVEKEKVFGKAITFFTVLAIFISCLGLYGLAAFTAEQRTKEIGIRKVLGASASAIVFMLNKNFTKLILISIVIAVPVSVFCMSKWLDGFAYKISIEAWIFFASASGALLVALAAVSYHSLKAAWIDPAKTLKYE